MNHPPSHRLIEQLHHTEVFCHLTSREQELLAQQVHRRSMKKGDILCYQGEEWRSVLLISSGLLRSVINSPDGRQYVVSTWKAGEEFWSHTLLDDDPMPSTLEIAQHATVYQWVGETAYQMVLANHDATRALIRRQTQLIRKRRESIYNLAFNPVSSRLAKLIVDKFASSDNPTMQRDLTLEDMASMVASSPEVICRILYQFQAEGYLQVNRANITLHNLAALEKLIIKD